jgi:hypothetical protein
LLHRTIQDPKPSSRRKPEAGFNSRRLVIHFDFARSTREKNKIKLDPGLRWDDGRTHDMRIPGKLLNKD